MQDRTQYHEHLLGLVHGVDFAVLTLCLACKETYYPRTMFSPGCVPSSMQRRQLSQNLCMEEFTQQPDTSSIFVSFNPLNTPRALAFPSHGFSCSLRVILFSDKYSIIHRFLLQPYWADLKQCVNLCADAFQFLNMHFVTAGTPISSLKRLSSGRLTQSTSKVDVE